MPHRLILLSVVALLGLTALVYWPGLSGPFLLDDLSNLQPVRDWTEGRLGFANVVTGNASGPLGRPLSMATFAANAALGGYSPYSFKLGNLVLHLLCGSLIFALFSTLCRRDSRMRNTTAWLPVAMTGVWLLHPLLVSTVLYSVQRMAILSALFTLTAMLCWWHGRQAIENGDIRRGSLLMFGAFPAMTILATLSKETGLLAPFLCWVLEAAYFSPRTGDKRPLAARLFIGFACVLPLLAGVTAFLFQPERLLGGYANREFTLTERLLTEPRVLFDYLGALLMPWGPSMGIFQDDYLVSKSVVSPPSTFFALAGWVTLMLLGWRLRRSVPALAAGIGLYLVGHALESSVVPLYIYFEHRNYLPSIGAILAFTGAAAWAADCLKQRMDSPGLVFTSCAAGLILGLAAATYARTTVWQNKEAILASSLKHHPNSRGLRMEIAHFAMNLTPANVNLAASQYHVLLQQKNPVDREIGSLGLAAMDCFTQGRLHNIASNSLLASKVEVFGPELLSAVRNLSEIVIARPCEDLPPQRLAELLVAWLDRSPVDEARITKWHARYLAARLHMAAHGSSSNDALSQARIAWLAGKDPAVGATVISLLIGRQDYDDALILLGEVNARVHSHDQRGKEVLKAYADAIANSQGQLRQQRSDPAPAHLE